MRTVPALVRQSKNTKVAASRFGVAVKSAAAIRAMLKPVLPDPTNNVTRYELDGALRKWLQTNPLEKTEPENSISAFQELSFNKAARPGSLFRMVKVERFAENDVLIQFPAFNPLAHVTAPKGTGIIQINLNAAVLSFLDIAKSKCERSNWRITYEDKELNLPDIILPQVTASKSLVLLVMGIEYFRANESKIDQMRWKPMEIVGSFYN